uniref:Uncharacterized protein n=1 Tax=Moniliophthora roreri TaxID=221103 RepID=A0A0W0FB58_MONRR
MSRTSPSPPENNLTEPLLHPSVFLTLLLQTTTPNPLGVSETGLPQRTSRTPPPGPSNQSLLNSPNESNTDTETTKHESPRSSSPTNPVSMTDFLNVINAADQVTIHRIVEITSVQFAMHTALTISLNIAHDFEGVSEFLLQALPATINLLMDLRTTMVILPPLATSLTNHTSIEEGSEDGSTITTMVCITDNREPFTITTSTREERMFIPVRYINDAVVFEAGTLNVNRG